MRLIVSVVLVVLSAVTAWGQFRTVTVQNANSNPVPTNIQNTPDVNIVNTPNVTATISGTPAVSITGTPNVSVSGTPTVSVSNLPTGTAGPTNVVGVLIKNLDEPARQSVHKHLSCNTIVFGNTFCTATYSVPAGKQLVIEYLQASSFEPGADPHTYNYQLTTIIQGQMETYEYLPGAGAQSNTKLSDHLVRIYADPGSTLTFEGNQTSGVGNVYFTLVFSGYFVDVP